MKSLTPAEKLYKKDSLNLIHTRNKALIAWATKKLVTFEDLLVSVGHDRETLRVYYPHPVRLSEQLTRPTIMEFFSSYELALEQTRDGIGKNFRYEPIEHEYENWPANVKPQDLTVVPAKFTELTVVDKTIEEVLATDETLPPSPNQKCSLFAFQERAAARLLNGIVKENKHGQLLRAGVGVGKTFIVGAVLRRLLDMHFTLGKSYSPWPIVYVTKASIVEQTERVLQQFFNICTVTEVKVLNIEQLRTAFGELMVRCETVIVRGEEQLKWKWREGVHPMIICWDECQILKNTQSQQSQIAQAFNDIRDVPTYQIFFSATPYMRVCEAKCFSVGTRLKTKYGVQEGVPLSNDSWADFSAHTASPAEPEEYCEAAIERLMDKVNNYIVDVKGVRPQFNAHNSTQLIQFRTAEEKQFYDAAWQRYEKMRQKINGFDLSSGQSKFLILAQFTIFRKAAELCRAEYLADAMYESVQKGEAACLAVNFKGTIRRVVQILNDKYGVSRDLISLIWGGGKTKKTKKQENKELFTQNDMMKELLGEMGIGLADIGMDSIDDYVDDDPNDEITNSLRLGTQSKPDRQKEIDRFQSGKSLYCMFTFKAGGVGLSLHHTDEQTKQKARRKKNNWVVVEDVPNIPTRPRVCFLAPTFSAIELVQGLGRCPRLTSFSDTTQVIVFYESSIEERVAEIVSQKLKCLKKVVRQKESWESCIVNPGTSTDTTPIITNDASLNKNKPTEDEDEDNGLFGDEEDDE